MDNTLIESIETQMSNYPDSVSPGDPSAPWNQPDDDREPQWFMFEPENEHSIMLSVKELGPAECAEVIADINKKFPNVEIELLHGEWTE